MIISRCLIFNHNLQFIIYSHSYSIYELYARIHLYAQSAADEAILHFSIVCNFYGYHNNAL